MPPIDQANGQEPRTNYHHKARPASGNVGTSADEEWITFDCWFNARFSTGIQWTVSAGHWPIWLDRIPVIVLATHMLIWAVSDEERLGVNVSMILYTWYSLPWKYFQARHAVLNGIVRFTLRMSEAADQMIIHQTRRLHKRIADSAANKAEASLFQIHAHRIRQGSICRYLQRCWPVVLNRRSINEIPEILIKIQSGFLHIQTSLCIFDKCPDF